MKAILINAAMILLFLLTIYVHMSSADKAATEKNAAETIELSNKKSNEPKELANKPQTKIVESKEAPKDPSPTSHNADAKTEKPKSEKKATIVVPEDEIVNLQSEMDVHDLIKTISEITGESFILHGSVKKKGIRVVAPEGFRKKDAMRLFETVLNLNGLSLVKKNGTNIIILKRDVRIKSLPTDVGTAYGEPSDNYVTRLVELKSVEAQEASKMLKPLISREGAMIVHPATNTLIIVETVDNLNRILTILEHLDVQTEIEFINIHNAEAAEVAIKLVEIFSGTGATQSRSQTKQIKKSGSKGVASKAGQQEQTTYSFSTAKSSAIGFKVILDERTSSLIIIAYPDDMEEIKAVVEMLDVKTDQAEEGIYVIQVLNVEAEQLVNVLSNLLGGRGGGTASVASSGGSQTDSTTGFAGESGFSTQGIRRRSPSGSSIVAEAEGLRVTADPATNSIIVIGSRRDYEEIKGVIKKLDVRRKQVFVEAAILEVSLDNLRSFGANSSIGFKVNDDNLAFSGANLPGVPSLLGLATAESQTAIQTMGSLSGLFLGVVGKQLDPDGSGPIPAIPSFTALFQAITSITDVNVLSTPSIITTDNETAKIVVADVIPFPTGSTVGTSGVTVSTIQREPVGIKLLITPQISDGEYLNLNILTEVSAIRATPEGLNTNEFGIATTTRTADSSVVVKDGQTIVIGGLVQDRESILQNRVPLLGGVPILGNLFKYKSTQRQKINLMILLTPRIVETEEDMDLLLQEKQKRNMLIQERGFYKGK